MSRENTNLNGESLSRGTSQLKIIKLGGSVITDPLAENLFDKSNATRFARELLSCHQGCVIVHGTGHVGKPPAIKYNYYKSGILKAGNTPIGTEIRDSISHLNRLIIQELVNAGIPAVTIESRHLPWITGLDLPPFHLKEMILKATGSGYVPVFSADFLPRNDGSFIVLSSDKITLMLAKMLQPDKVLFLTDVDGVYRDYNTPRQSIMPVLTEKDLGLLQPTESKDVSGGMRKKVEAALEVAACCNTCVIGSGYKEGVMKDFLTGNVINGTRVM